MDFQDLQLFAAECAKTVIKKAPEGTLFIVVLHHPNLEGGKGSAISGNVAPGDMQKFLSLIRDDLKFVGAQGIEEN